MKEKQIYTLHLYAERCGIPLIYLTVMMIVLVGLCSLAADYGYVQLAKTELRQAPDSAARA